MTDFENHFHHLLSLISQRLAVTPSPWGLHWTWDETAMTRLAVTGASGKTGWRLVQEA